MFIAKVNLQEMDEKAQKIETVRGNLYFLPYINHSEGWVCLEDFKPGEIVTWQFWYAEVQYVFQGRARITYSLPPLHAKKEEVVVGPGDVFLIPNGADLRYEVISEEPFRHLCVIMPGRPEFLQS